MPAGLCLVILALKPSLNPIQCLSYFLFFRLSITNYNYVDVLGQHLPLSKTVSYQADNKGATDFHIRFTTGLL
jgi:hypothetical protein